jgi:hypothetical protein
MTDIKGLRAAMHAAVDSEQFSADELIRQVMRRHRRHRRNVALAGVAALIALAVAVPVAIAVHGALLTSGPRPSLEHPTPRPHRLPTKMTGLPMPAGTNLRLLLETANKYPGTVKAAWYSTATRQTEPIAHLPRADYSFFRHGGGWSVAVIRNTSACAGYWCAGPPVQAYFIADGSLTATRIGAGFQVQSSNRDGAVWLVSYPRSTDNIRTTSARVQLVSTTGQPLGPRYRLPAGYLLDRGVGNYLLLSSVRTRPRPPYLSELWDPRTGQVVRRVDNVFGVGPGQIAWNPGCRGCRAQVLNVSTGQSVTLPIHGGQLSGFFSDDGRLLAMQPASGNGPLVVFDTQTRALTVIPGTALRFSVAMSFSWQNGGHRLIVLAAPGNSSLETNQVAYWDPGDTRLRVATIQIPGGLGAVVTAFPPQ